MIRKARINSSRPKLVGRTTGVVLVSMSEIQFIKGGDGRGRALLLALGETVRESDQTVEFVCEFVEILPDVSHSFFVQLITFAHRFAHGVKLFGSDFLDLRLAALDFGHDDESILDFQDLLFEVHLT